VNQTFNHALFQIALTQCLDRNNLTPLIKTARRAHPVRDVWRRALRASAQLRKREHRIIRAAHTLPAPRRFTFGNTHTTLSISTSFSFYSRRIHWPFAELPELAFGTRSQSAPHSGRCGKAVKVACRHPSVKSVALPRILRNSVCSGKHYLRRMREMAG
jgi:hypothetical protein